MTSGQMRAEVRGLRDDVKDLGVCVARVELPHSRRVHGTQAGGGGSPTVDQPGNDLITKKGLAGDS